MDTILVKLNQGIVKGCRESLPSGRKFQRFTGIPYAKPPIGELRFKAPKKLEKFEFDEIDCTKEGNASFHRSSFSREILGSEDCLILNVFVPENTSSKKLPVMFFIHGGGFSFDSSTLDFYSPEYLLMEDVIVVTINYRLHIFGFLCLPSVGVYGNAGLKDQQMALEWVFENISNFGGDPNNICIFGESAGAASVHFQVLNEKSRKMIKSAIMQSSCALCDWAIVKDGVSLTRRLAKLLGCEVDDDQERFKTIMAASKEELLKYYSKPQDPDERRRNLILTFKPIIEIESDEAFMSKKPLDIIKSIGNSLNIPMIFGTNDKDGIAMTSFFVKQSESFNNDYVRLLPMGLKIDPDSEDAKYVSKEIKEFYFRKNKIFSDPIDTFVDFATDTYFLIPQTMSNELHAKYNPNCKQFLYEFRFDGELNHLKTLARMDHVNGAAHADELGYLFYQRILNPIVKENSKEARMIKKMCKLWTNFAKYQDPTPSNSDNSLKLKWKPIENANKLNYFIIDDEDKIVLNLHKERIDFWRALYRKWNNDFLVAKL